MSKRLAQLLSRYIGVGLMALAGALGIEDDGTIAANSEAIALGIASVVAFLIDVLMHRAATGSIMKPASSSSQVSKMLILGLLLVGASGCSMSDSQRYAMYSASYRASADATATLIRTGVIADKDQLEDIRTVNGELKEELDAMHEAIVNDIPLDFKFIKLRVESLLGRLIQYQLDVERQSDDTSSSNSSWPPVTQSIFELNHYREASKRRVAGLNVPRAQRSQAA